MTLDRKQNYLVDNIVWRGRVRSSASRNPRINRRPFITPPCYYNTIIIPSQLLNQARRVLYRNTGYFCVFILLCAKASVNIILAHQMGKLTVNIHYVRKTQSLNWFCTYSCVKATFLNIKSCNFLFLCSSGSGHIYITLWTCLCQLSRSSQSHYSVLILMSHIPTLYCAPNNLVRKNATFWSLLV